MRIGTVDDKPWKINILWEDLVPATQKMLEENLDDESVQTFKNKGVVEITFDLED